MRILPALASALILSAASTTAEAACGRCDPIFNVADAPATSASGKALTNDQVRQAIIRAGAALGWVMKENGPGKLSANLAVRKHTAEIEIPYSSKGYSINYKNSTNLDAADGQIHKNYNGWIQNLNKGINAQLSAS
ncbi:MAG: hypothetical protein ABIR98_14700 [Usitatibacter sp.]